MPRDPQLERTLAAVQADLDAVELALAELEAGTVEVDLDGLEADAEPGRLAEHLALRRSAAVAADEDGPGA